MRGRFVAVAVGLAAALAACFGAPTGNGGAGSGDAGAPAADASSVPATILAPVVPANVRATLKAASGAHADLCENDGSHPKFPDDADGITRTFCQDSKPGGVMPTPTSLAELLVVLGLDFKDPKGGNGVGGNPAFAILGHSSALTARKVTPVAPTAFIFTPPTATGAAPAAYTILAFDPGEQFVEVASYDPVAKVVNFYIVFFDQSCMHAAAGCTHADVFTPALVTGWSNLRIYEDTTELGNTILDCHVCHQPNNAKDPFLRMQEIVPPFTHWFSSETAGGRSLLGIFHSLHDATEDYGGIPAALIDKSDPSKLAALVTQTGAGQQPNMFDSNVIEAEVAASGRSATWQTLYDRAAAGEFIAAPYYGIDVSDPVKVSAAKVASDAFKAKTSTIMPDLADVFRDDGLRDMSFAPKLGLDGRGLLVQMCQECHHSQLDMTLSRENFLIDRLDQMSRAAKDLAIERLQASPIDRLAMPPVLFRTVTADERGLMIDELRK